MAEVALAALAAPSASLSAERRLLGWAGWADGVYMDWVIMLVEEVERLEREEWGKKVIFILPSMGRGVACQFSAVAAVFSLSPLKTP